MVKIRVNNSEQSGNRSDYCNKIKANEQHDPYKPHAASGLYHILYTAKDPVREIFFPQLHKLLIADLKKFLQFI